MMTAWMMGMMTTWMMSVARICWDDDDIWCRSWPEILVSGLVRFPNLVLLLLAKCQLGNLTAHCALGAHIAHCAAYDCIWQSAGCWWRRLSHYPHTAHCAIIVRLILTMTVRTVGHHSNDEVNHQTSKGPLPRNSVSVRPYLTLLCVCTIVLVLMKSQREKTEYVPQLLWI